MASTNSQIGDSDVGAQRPTHEFVPDYVSSSGKEAVELAAMAGLELDDWQKHVLSHALGERADGSWAAFEVGLCVARQNGKGAILEARELAGLFLLGERLIIHSAHQFDTSLEAFRRLLDLVEATPDFDRRVRRVSRSHGEEGIELRGGQRIRFRTRTKGGGRGFSSDCLILDEAMFLPESAHGALLPTLSARPNPQVWYTGSAVDQFVHPDGVVLARLRDRAIKGGGDGAFCYFEWTLDADRPTAVTETEARSPESHAKTNPGFGIRIAAEHIANEQQSMDHRTFAVERLNVGDWPTLVEDTSSVIDIDAWDALADEHSTIVGPVAFSADVMPDRSSSAICAAGRRADGLWHTEVIECRRGTGWLVDRLVELTRKHPGPGVAVDGVGPVGSLIPELQSRDVTVTALAASDHAKACGNFVDIVGQEDLRHLGTQELRSAIKGATTRPLGDSWAWSRKNASVDISPLVSATLALWLASTTVPSEPMLAFA